MQLRCAQERLSAKVLSVGGILAIAQARHSHLLEFALGVPGIGVKSNKLFAVGRQADVDNAPIFGVSISDD